MAVSQNLMHANLGITDGVYGMLAGFGVKGQIEGLGHKTFRAEKILASA